MKSEKEISDLEKLRKKWKGTIGIIGGNPELVSQLNQEMIAYGNANLGLVDDQHFPEMLSIGIKCDAEKILNQVDICYDFGCDVLALAQEVDQEFDLTARFNLLESPNNSLKIFALQSDLAPEEALKKLAAETMEYACHQVDKPRRPNLICQEFEEDIQEEELRNLEKDRLERNRRIEMRRSGSCYQYPILIKNPFVGVIGGAGPMASATFTKELVNTNFIHYSACCVPGKHRYEMTGAEKGPPYKFHYQNIVECFDSLRAIHFVIPCNTTHGRLPEFINNDLISKLVDMRREAMLGIKKMFGSDNTDPFILLGTSKTTGVGLPSGEVGAYEKLRRSELSDVVPEEFIVSDLEQHQKIMEAIYDVKAGNMEIAKEKINQVANELRNIHGKDLPAILACTELPLPFTPQELQAHNYVDPAVLTAQACQKLLADEMNKITKDKEELSKLASQTTSGVSSKASSKASSPSGKRGHSRQNSVEFVSPRMLFGRIASSSGMNSPGSPEFFRNDSKTSTELYSIAVPQSTTISASATSYKSSYNSSSNKSGTPKLENPDDISDGEVTDGHAKTPISSDEDSLERRASTPTDLEIKVSKEENKTDGLLYHINVSGKATGHSGIVARTNFLNKAKMEIFKDTKMNARDRTVQEDYSSSLTIHKPLPEVIRSINSWAKERNLEIHDETSSAKQLSIL